MTYIIDMIESRLAFFSLFFLNFFFISLFIFWQNEFHEEEKSWVLELHQLRTLDVESGTLCYYPKQDKILLRNSLLKMQDDARTLSLRTFCLHRIDSLF